MIENWSIIAVNGQRMFTVNRGADENYERERERIMYFYVYYSGTLKCRDENLDPACGYLIWRGEFYLIHGVDGTGMRDALI